MVSASLVGCRFLWRDLSASFTFQNRNTAFDPLSVNLGTAATNSRTGNWRRSVKLGSVAILVAVIQQLSFWDSGTRQIKPVNPCPLKRALTRWLKHWTAEVLTTKRRACIYGNFMLWSFHGYFLCIFPYLPLPAVQRSHCGTSFLNCNMWWNRWIYGITQEFFLIQWSPVHRESVFEGVSNFWVASPILVL